MSISNAYRHSFDGLMSQLNVLGEFAGLPIHSYLGTREKDIYNFENDIDEETEEEITSFVKDDNKDKGVKPMNFGFDDMGNMFKGMFKPIEDGCCKMAMNGKIAVKTSNGYKTYDLKKKRLTNVGSFAFDMFNMFWSIPTNHVEVGDIIIVNKGGRKVPRCVTKVEDDVITAIDYEDNEIRQILPERHILMGKVYFYAKIFCPFKNMLSNGGGLDSMVKMAMMSQMFGGNGGDNSGNPFGNMMPLMLMSGKDSPFSSIFGGKDGNIFEGMFDGLDFSSSEEATADEVEADTDDED